MSAICPECDSPIDVDEFDVDIGDELTCSECGSLLRVAGESPLEFEAADEDDDDLDDDNPDEVRATDDDAGDTADDDFDDDDDDDDDEDDDGFREDE